MKKVSEGAEALIYASETLGYPTVVKARNAKSYRERTLDEHIRTQRTKSEARIIAKASSNGINTPKVLMVSNNGIVMGKLGGKMLSSMLKIGNVDNKIISEAGRQLALLHKTDITHGDYTPANIMVDGAKVWVIDFGLGEVTNSIEEKALDVLLMKRSLSKEHYSVFERSYRKNYSEAGAVLKRLAQIEKRGRYQTRTLASEA